MTSILEKCGEHVETVDIMPDGTWSESKLVISQVKSENTNSDLLCIDSDNDYYNGPQASNTANEISNGPSNVGGPHHAVIIISSGILGTINDR
jgi:hypothetical protein